MQELFSTALFKGVQMLEIFADGKTFVDCTPLASIEKINEIYLDEKDKPGFDLKAFVLTYFECPVAKSNHHQSDLTKTVEENIEALWPLLTREPAKASGSLLPLPFPYIVPGGRFGEIYYWDSYFTMLGLAASDNNTMIEYMVNNFSFLIDTYGYIPNGNRSYFIGRSQPPFYALMIQLLAEKKGKEVLVTYLPQLEKEYRYWMLGAKDMAHDLSASKHVVRLPDGEILNRYWDDHDTPRPESYREDVELSHNAAKQPSALYRDLRAGAESGWDYSSRWFKKENDFSSIHTTDIIPVDLNCLIVHLEETLAAAYSCKGDASTAANYSSLALARKNAIEKYCWNQQLGFYFDYDFQDQEQKKAYSLAGIAPLFFKIAHPDQAIAVAQIIKEKFLVAGGLCTTPVNSGQQWDAPNGWAPLHWMSVIGLENYDQLELANEIANRWLTINRDVFKRTGKLMEKYNVVDVHLEAGGGEYEGQDGFGWTNGVFLALAKRAKNS